jgi:hypothetical protein
MSNRRPKDIGIPSFATKVDIATGNETAGVNISQAGAGYESAAKFFNESAARAGAYADEQAQLEGTRAGKIAAGQEGYKPTEQEMSDTSLYGRSKSQAASALYAQNVQASFGSDVDKLYETSKDDPVKFQSGMKALKQRYEQDHLVPEMGAAFNAHFTSTLSSKLRAVNAAKEANDKNESVASLYRQTNENDTNRARLLMGNPNDPATIAAAEQKTATNLNAIAALRDAGNITPQQAEKMIADEKVNARTQIVTAQTARMNGEEILTYQQNFRDKFQKGELKDVDASLFKTIDDSLTQTAKRQDVAGMKLQTDLRNKWNDVIERARNGLPATQAELAALEGEAQKLGAGGVDIMNNSKKKLEFVRHLNTLSPKEAEAEIQKYEQSARGYNVIDKIIGVESAGKANAQNSRSSAGGLGQFIDSTWVQMLRKHRPDVADGKSDAALIDMKYNASLSREMTTRYAEENERGLKSYGITPTAGNVYLAHFAGLGGAQRLHSNPSGDAALVMAGGDANKAEGIREANGFLRGKSAQDVINWAARKMGGASGDVGISKQHAEDSLFMRNHLKSQQQTLSTDALQAARSRNLILDITPFSASAPVETIGQQIQSRIAQQDAVATHFKQDLQILRPQEKDEINTVLKKGGAEALPMMQALLQGSGAKNKTLVKELLGEDNEAGKIAMLMMGGASKQTISDMAEYAKVKEVENVKMNNPPPEKMETIQDVIGLSLDHHPEDKARIIAMADSVYKVRAFRFNVQGKDKEATTLYRDALQDAMGANRVEGAQVGGFVKYKGYSTIVPQGVIADKFTSIISSLTQKDLQAMPIPPIAESGYPYAISAIHNATPVKFGAGYRFIAGDPHAATPQYIRGKDGNPFVMPFDDMREMLERRVPAAFVGGMMAERKRQQDFMDTYKNMNSAR